MVEPRTTRSDLLGASAAAATVLIFSLLLLWHDPLLFWNDDYELSILPVFADVARSWSEGHWPLLSPYSWVCNNLAGEFQYGTFSIFVNAAVVLIWKFPLAFAQQAAALSMTHLVVLAIGGFLLARGRNLSIQLSIFVALVAALNGWIVCWGATDWFGALGAFAWLPWAWWSMEKSTQQKTPNAQRSTLNVQFRSFPFDVLSSSFGVRRFLAAALWPAPFVYLVITGGFPYTVLMLALLIVWLSIKSLAETKSLMSILPMLAGVALGVGLAAPAWLALLDYVHGSARAETTASAHWQWIVPWKALPALILPSWTVNWADFSTRYLPHTATELACGLVAPAAVISLCTAGLAIRDSRIATLQRLRQIRWELAFLGVVLVLAMLPTAGVFRWSFRWLPLFHLVLALCAAHALQRQVRIGPVLLVLTGTFVVITGVFHTGGEYAFPLTWILLALAVIWFALERWERPESICGCRAACVTFAALLATYLCIPPNCGVPKYNLSQQLLQPAPLDPQRLYLSIYPPAEHTYRTTKKAGPVGQVVRPGSTSMWAGVRLVNGYSPILAAGVAREFGFAIHGEIDPDMGGYLLADQSGVLEQLGIDGLMVASDIKSSPPNAEWRLAFSNNEGRVFHRRERQFDRVRSINWIDSRPGEEFATATISDIDDSRNRVQLDVDVPRNENPALLEFSRPYFRGYLARLENHALPVTSYRGLIPLVEVPAGAHGRLTLTYRPRWLVYGGGLSILCAVVWVVGVVAAARLWRQNPGPCRQ